ncbi:MAG: hypothetical protein A2096_10765 [Spirochaetes bacterium GWF1_41_5]|nr:MAG: hypothetical protein A2096_10765 [Spirochaetes bacterium GWF1_41_5]HBE01419.1 hypothetical protein [Spirochaetia bacterium]
MKKKIIIAAVGNLTQSWAVIADDYIRRIERVFTLETIIIRENRLPPENSGGYEKELQKIFFSLIPSKAGLGVCSPEGKSLDSPGFSRLIFSQFEKNDCLVFAVGGGQGIPEAVKKKADTILSFSNMVFPHMLFRIMLFEQIYRAITIRNHHPYHK